MTKRKSIKLNYTVPKDSHWKGQKPNLEEFVGFVYEIKNLVTGQMYIGRKLYWIHAKRKKVRQNDWHKYTGSSTQLNKDIKKLGKSNFRFKILRQYPDKSSLRYGESEMIYKRKALTSYDDKGNKLYYNGQIDRCFTPTCWWEGNKLRCRDDFK